VDIGVWDIKRGICIHRREFIGLQFEDSTCNIGVTLGLHFI